MRVGHGVVGGGRMWDGVVGGGRKWDGMVGGVGGGAKGGDPPPKKCREFPTGDGRRETRFRRRETVL